MKVGRIEFSAPRRNRTVDLGPRALADIFEKARFSIHVDRALLCLDCESIFEASGDQSCPSCGSRVAWAIGRALNRQSRQVSVKEG